MALSGKEFQEIQAALLDGYGDLFDLRQMVRFGLDDSLDAIAGGRNLTEQIFNLIEWADRKGRVLDLVRSAYEYNQGNEALKRLHDARIEPPERESVNRPSIVSSQTTQVFLSYSSEDTDSMRRVAQMMSEQGVSVWTAEGLEPGSPDWQIAIESALRNTECMVVLLSPDAKQSRWVSIEIAVTQRLGRRIFPVLIRGTRDKAVPISLETVQYIDARDKYKPTIENRLIPAVARYLGVSGGVVSGKQASQGPTSPFPQPDSPVKTPEVEVPRSSYRPSLEFDWVTVPAGEFLMGSDKQKDPMADDAEFLQHTVYLPTYRIARVPVTNAQYKVFVDATEYKAPGNWKDGNIPKGEENHPLVNVSWDDAQAFCEWASVCLPTEAEWEKAARGTNGRVWPWGDNQPNEGLCNFNKNVNDTTSVDSYSDGASPYGCLDMAGNVWEWTSSLYKDYPYDAADGREGPDTTGRRVLRGGSFNLSARYLRCAARYGSLPDLRHRSYGFRLCAAPITPGR